MHCRSKASIETPIVTPHGETIYELQGAAVGPEGCRHSVALIEIAPGRSSIRHHHPEMEEVYLVQSGQGFLELGDEEQVLGPGDLVTIPPGVPHKISNHEADILELCVTCVPPWTPDCSVFHERWNPEREELEPAPPHTTP
mgnify:CR=1 FL=1